MRATLDTAEITGDTICGEIENSEQIIKQIVRLGIDFSSATDRLEAEGVEKFEIAWNELNEAVVEAMQQ